MARQQVAKKTPEKKNQAMAMAAVVAPAAASATTVENAKKQAAETAEASATTVENAKKQAAETAAASATMDKNAKNQAATTAADSATLDKNAKNQAATTVAKAKNTAASATATISSKRKGNNSGSTTHGNDEEETEDDGSPPPKKNKGGHGGSGESSEEVDTQTDSVIVPEDSESDASMDEAKHSDDNLSSEGINDDEDSLGGNPDDVGSEEDAEDGEGEDINNFKVQEYLVNAQKETPLVAYGLQCKISIGLLPLSFFVAQNEHILFCQPQINHRNVSLVDVKDLLVNAALEEKARGKGFEEELMVVIYELTSTEDVSAVPIYATYQTELSEDASPYQIPGCFAKFPTKDGILKLLQSLNMTSVVDSGTFNDATDESGGYLTKDLLWKVFNSTLFEDMNVGNKDFFPNTTEAKKLSTDDTTFPEAYRRIKTAFQKEHNIRFAFMGGNHRMATAVHLFGGYKVEPNKALNIDSEIKDYGLRLNMKITASPSITVVIPKSNTLTEEFIDQCNIYSYIVEKRKTESIEVTFGSLSSTIINEKKHPEINKKRRFLPSLIFTDEKSMTQVNKWRLEITCQEASLLISNPPTKQIATKYSTRENKFMNENQKIALLEKKIRTFTATSALHLGFAHGTSGTSSNIEFPEALLCILWMHRWAIANESTFRQFRNLLRTDIVFEVQQKRRFDFYNPVWLRKNIINNVVKTIKVLVDDNTKTHLLEKYKDPKKITTRLKASLMHYLTTEIVKNLLWCGPNPKSLLPQGSDSAKKKKQKKNLKEIDDQLRINLSTLRDSNTDNEKKRLLPITYVEAILASIPNIIQANIENPVAGGLFDNILKDNPEQGETQATWKDGTSWEKFKIYIPVTTTNIAGVAFEESSVRQPDCSISTYFKSVLKGNIPSKLLFLQPVKKGKDKKTNEKKAAAPKIDVAKALKAVESMKGTIEGIKDDHVRELLFKKIDFICEICNIEEKEEVEETKQNKKV